MQQHPHQPYDHPHESSLGNFVFDGDAVAIAKADYYAEIAKDAIVKAVSLAFSIALSAISAEASAFTIASLAILA